MKTSNRILFITGLVIVVILLAMVLGSRIFLNKYTDSYKNGDINYSNIDKEYKEIEDFSKIDITGEWDITISQSDSFSVIVTGRKGSENPYNLKREGNTLFLEENEDLNLNRDLSVKITMPEILEVYSRGGLKLELNDFSEQNLTLDLTGGSWVTGNNSRIENLRITSAGAINLEFEEIKTVNVDAQLAGAGNLIFNMAGGTLSGNAAGAMNIEYYGEARQEIKAAGLANISRWD